MRTRVLTSSITFLIKVSFASPRLTVGLQPFISAPLNQRDKSAAEIYLMHASLGSQRETVFVKVKLCHLLHLTE